MCSQIPVHTEYAERREAARGIVRQELRRRQIVRTEATKGDTDTTLSPRCVDVVSLAPGPAGKKRCGNAGGALSYLRRD